MTNEGWHGEAISYTLLALGEADDIQYELRNCIRGSYSIGGTENEDLAYELRKLVSRLEDCITDIENQPSQASMDTPDDEDEE